MACQDFARFIGISRYDPAYAIRLDVAWLVLFLVAYVVLKQEGLTSLAWLFGAWSGAGALVGLWTLRAHFARTRRRQLLEFWDRSERGVGLRFAGQFMLVTSWTYFVSYLLLFVLPLASIGVFKLSQLALGPITVLLAGVQSALIALATKRFQVDTHKAVRFLLIGGVGSFALTMVWTGLVYWRAATRHGEPVRPQLDGSPGHPALRRPGGRLRQLRQRRGLRSARHAGRQREPPALRASWCPSSSSSASGAPSSTAPAGAAGGLAVAGAIYSVLSWSLLVKLARTFVPGTSAVVEDVVAEVSEP